MSPLPSSRSGLLSGPLCAGPRAHLQETVFCGGAGWAFPAMQRSAALTALARGLETLVIYVVVFFLTETSRKFWTHQSMVFCQNCPISTWDRPAAQVTLAV